MFSNGPHYCLKVYLYRSYRESAQLIKGKSIMRKFVFATVLILANGIATANASSLTVSFKWGKTPACSGGQPGIVNSPAFKVGHVPKGTKSLRFRMTDLDAPSYPHGGGTVAYHGKSRVSAGAFRYTGPCPPFPHTYNWSVEALSAKGKTLARGNVRRGFP